MGLLVNLHLLVLVGEVGGGHRATVLLKLGHEVLLASGKEGLLLADFLLTYVEGALVGGCARFHSKGFGLLAEEHDEYGREGGFEVLVLGVLDGLAEVSVLGAFLLELLFSFEELSVESGGLLGWDVVVARAVVGVVVTWNVLVARDIV